MPFVSRANASVRFAGDDLDPDEVSRLLGIAPSWSARMGDHIDSKASQPVVARTGVWIVSGPAGTGEDLDRRIMDLLSLNADVTAWQAVARRFRGDVGVGLHVDEFNEGVELAPTTLLAIGARGLVLGLDIYADEADAELRAGGNS